MLLPIVTMAQYDHTPVFTDLEGDDLTTAVINTYKPTVVLTYGQARDTLFSKIDAVNDSLECAYTGMKRYLTPGADPTQSVFLNGMPNGINTEHSYPQSKGAGDGNARSDMHHLYPTRVKTNGDRGSLIFAESNDTQTTTWYLGISEQSNTPNNNIDEYSELGNSVFEPRESYKGNIARSLMYFYTMYKSEADAADPAFFELQRETLCDWHYADPVDQVEWERSQKIANWQEGKANPFVLDCSLAARIYCDEISVECMTVDIDEEAILNVNIYPNPTAEILYIDGVDAADVSITSANGLTKNYKLLSGKVNIADLDSGIYFLSFVVDNQTYSRTFVKL